MRLLAPFMFLNISKIAVVFSFIIQNSLKDSRVVRVNTDGTNMYKCLLQYFLFPENPDLFSISTGVLIDGRTNCHKSLRIGQKDINRLVVDFRTVKFKRTNGQTKSSYCNDQYNTSRQQVGSYKYNSVPTNFG